MNRISFVQSVLAGLVLTVLAPLGCSSARKECKDCDGVGSNPVCFMCDGKGQMAYASTKCEYCKGTGKDGKCVGCDGKGYRIRCELCNGIGFSKSTNQKCPKCINGWAVDFS